MQRFEGGGYLFYVPGPPGQSGTIFAVSDGGGFSDEAWACRASSNSATDVQVIQPASFGFMAATDAE